MHVSYALVTCLVMYMNDENQFKHEGTQNLPINVIIVKTSKVTQSNIM